LETTKKNFAPLHFFLAFYGAEIYIVTSTQLERVLTEEFVSKKQRKEINKIA
jgi:hypothetical protein